jgi:hypothetical protein
MRTRIILMAAAILLGAAPASGAAQTFGSRPPFPQFEPGTRVRVVVPEAQRTPVVGTVVEMDEEAITVRQDRTEATWRFPLENVRRIDVSVGERTGGGAVGSSIQRGGFVGFGVGLLMGGAYHAAQNIEKEGGGGLSDSLTTGLLAGVGGAAAGALLGGLMAPDSQEIFVDSAPPQPFSIAPSRDGGLAVGVSLRVR